VEEILRALGAQMDELDGLLAGLDDEQWQLSSACPGWTIADVVLHLAQTDEYAVASARGGLGSVAAYGWTAPSRGEATVDDTAAAFVEAERWLPPARVHERWRQASGALLEALAACRPDQRVPWVVGDLAARTLATTRLAECWIHTGDIAHGLGVEPMPSDRLWHIARLAHRTLPYAFARAGRELRSTVSFRLSSPLDPDAIWVFGDGDPRGTMVVGPAQDLCLVAGRRRDAAGTALVATGPDADAVLALVRTFA
jgi:uncharacterized protein (TIGR03084 family)